MKALSFSLIALILVSQPAPSAETVDYVREIKPIFLRNCIACHGPQKQRSELRLDTAVALLKGGNSGSVVIPGKSADSQLIKMVSGTKDLPVMPPKGERLSVGQIALLKKWIDQGAKAPANEQPLRIADVVKSAHWAFQRPVRPAEPQVKLANWVRNPIDRFILARLEKEGIAPSPEADRVTLIRRLSLDLLGLPPSVEDVNAFLLDNRPDAYDRLVSRLLDSPHYGERWGRHWLDQARYADSNGFTIDSPRPMWKYRDWVIDSLNRDLPFDQFAVDQLAGDLLEASLLPRDEAKSAATPKTAPAIVSPASDWRRDQYAHLVATGFHRNTLRNEEGGIDLEQFRVESIVDRVATTGSVFLGLTVGCCQCHDHKFDPLSQREYYQFFAFLNNAEEPALELLTPEQRQRRQTLGTRLADLDKRRRTLDFTTAEQEYAWAERATVPALREKFEPKVRAILELPENGRSPAQKRVLTQVFRKLDMARHAVAGFANPLPFLTAAHGGALANRLAWEGEIWKLKEREPDVDTSLVMQERPTPRQTTVLIQGDFTRKGAPVQPGFFSVMHAFETNGKPPEKLNRLDLARWIVDPKNPLTPRVVVNRMWQQYFGLGIVETDNDFGTQGTPPSHPELLDWLATELIARKWSLKAVHHLIATSATYRQASRVRPELAVIDPRNRLLARQSRLRLEAEVVRDVALAASGLLSEKVGGPSVFPPQPEGVYAFTQVNKNWKASAGPDRYRRGLYTYFWRSAPHPGLTVFDASDANSACTRRNRSNTPLQALTLLNDQAYFEFAQGLAARVLKEPGSEVDRLRRAFRLCVAREPSDMEHKRLADLLVQQTAEYASFLPSATGKDLLPKEMPAGVAAGRFAAWITIARVLLNLDEFITRE